MADANFLSVTVNLRQGEHKEPTVAVPAFRVAVGLNGKLSIMAVAGEQIFDDGSWETFEVSRNPPKGVS